MLIRCAVAAAMTFAATASAQSSGRESRTVRVEVRSAAPADSGLARALARDLNLKLATLARPMARSIEVTARVAGEVVPHDTTLRAEHVSVLLSRVAVLVRALAVVTAPTGDPFEFEVTQASIPALADSLATQLAFRLDRRIRIGMLSFPMLRGDTAKYGGLDRSLPTMIGEGLTLSQSITLVQSLNEEQLEQLRTNIPQAAGLHDVRTAVTLGRRLHANYLLMGQYWELKEAVRVDVSCVNVETGAVVLTRGVTITDVRIQQIHREMTALAAVLRSIIENDFVPRARPRNVAVSAREPYPDSPINRRISEEIVRTVARKLKIARHDSLRVTEPSSERLEQYFDERVDGLLVVAELEADYLFSFSINRSQRDKVAISLDVVDAFNPADRPPTRQVITTLGNIDGHIEALVDSALSDIGVVLSKAQRESWREPTVRTVYESFGFHAQVGPSIRSDPAVFLDVAGGIAFEFGLAWMPFPSGRWMIQPLAVRFDFFGSRGKRTVVGGDLHLVTVNYRLRPLMTLNPYVGASFGIMGVFRYGTGDQSYDGRPAAGLVLGVEYLRESGRRLTYQLRWQQATEGLNGQTLGTGFYPPGRPGGWFASFGTTVF